MATVSAKGLTINEQQKHVLAKILYCSPTWSVLASASESDRSRIDAFLKQEAKLSLG